MTILYLAASTFLSLAGATSAHGPDPVTATADAPVTPVAVVRVKRYCIDDRREGVPRRPKICRTREDWQARGFDPLVAIGRL